VDQFVQYLLNHVWKEPVLLALVIGLAMALLSAAMDAALVRWGGRLGLADRADPAALPLAVALFSVILFLLTPLQNLIIRSYESEADAFGLNAAREPYGWAMGAMRLSTYRKIRPGRFEEFVFYDHPSGYARPCRNDLAEGESGRHGGAGFQGAGTDGGCDRQVNCR